MLSLLTPAGRRSIPPLLACGALAALLEVGALLALPAFFGSLNLATASWRETSARAGAVLLLLLCGTLATSLTLWLTHRLVWQEERRLSTALLRSYLSEPYARGAGTRPHSSALLSHDLAYGLLLPAAVLYTRGLPVACTAAVLIAANPGLAFCIGSFFVCAYAALSRYTGERVRQVGQLADCSSQERFTVAQEALWGRKAIAATASEAAFVARFDRACSRSAGFRMRLALLSDGPRALLEWIAAAALLGLVVLTVASGATSNSELMALLSLYGLAALRAIPAVHLLFAARSLLWFQQPTLREYATRLEAAEPSREVRPRKPLRHVLECRSLSFGYGDALVVRDVSFELKAGEWIGITGPSGGGKTTLADLLAGLLEPAQGEIRVDGEPGLPVCGYAPQEAFLLDADLETNVVFGRPFDADEMRECLRAARVDSDWQRRGSLGQAGRHLSGGQRQRVGIARALYGRPELLILDEATSALDGETEARLLTGLRARFPSAILITHRDAVLQLCDRVYRCHEGRLEP